MTEEQRALREKGVVNIEEFLSLQIFLHVFDQLYEIDNSGFNLAMKKRSFRLYPGHAEKRELLLERVGCLANYTSEL